VGLDSNLFDECLASTSQQDALTLATHEAQALGVTATPTFFVNGRPVFGAAPFEAFDEIVADELERARARSATRHQ
jgi:protein-disulfide isomerase